MLMNKTMEQNANREDDSIHVDSGESASSTNHRILVEERQDDVSLANSRRLSRSSPLATLPEARPQCSSTTPNTSISGGPPSESETTTTKQKYSAKLRSASRAIGLFRRAAGNLGRSLTLGQLNKSASSVVMGQNGILNDGQSNAAGSSSSSHQSRRANKRRRSSTFKRFMMRHQSTGDSSQNSQNSSQTNQGSSICGSSSNHQVHLGDQQQQQQQAAFIVPRMNALKLPLKCLIKSLEGELMREVFVHRYELGQYLIESLKVSLGMNDCKYFGLRLAKSCDDQEDVKNIWLDLNESVCKQIKNKSCSALLLASSVATKDKTGVINSNSVDHRGSSTTNNNSRTIEFYLRIKFYPPNLTRIQDSFLRNYLWLQLRRDLRLGKLTSSMNNLAQLMACILQYELGNFKQEHLEQLPAMNIMPNQDLVEDAAIEMWRSKLINFKRHQAQMQFLRAAIILETYGFDYYPVRDHQRQRAYLLGFNYAGVKTIRNGRIVHHFRWHSMSKISYERRMIIFHIYPTEDSKRKQILGFKCMSNDDCQCLYMRLLEQKYFFTVDLTYFDKSIRRPSCLYSSQNVSADQSAPDWTYNSIDDPRQQQQQTYGIRPNRLVRAPGSLEDPPTTTSVSSTPDCGGPCNDCCSPPGATDAYQVLDSYLVRSATSPTPESSFDNQTTTAPVFASNVEPTSGAETWHRRAALARLHCQQSTTVSFGDSGTRSEDAEEGPTAFMMRQKLASNNCSETNEYQGEEKPDFLPYTIFQNTLQSFYSLPTSSSLSSSTNIGRNYLMPILKLLLVILVTNLVLKLTDSLSCVLIALLTFSSSPVEETAAGLAGDING